MRSLAIVVALAFACSVARADEVDDLERLHARYVAGQRRVSIALLAGGLVSIGGGGALLGGGPSDAGWYWAGATTIGFGVIDALLGAMALPGLRSADEKWRSSAAARRTPEGLAAARRELFADAGRMATIYAINLGLDVGYVLGGAVAVLAGGLNAPPSPHSWIGAGVAGIVGGVFLIGIDAAGMLAAQHAQRDLFGSLVPTASASKNGVTFGLAGAF